MAQSLREIFEQSRRQLASRAGQNGVPSVTRDLGQIDILSKKLVAGSASATASSRAEGVPDAKAHYFLANAGVNTGELAEAVGNVDLRQTFEPLEPIHETDIQGFLRHEREQIIVSTIEETRRNTLRDFEELFKRTCAEWEKEKERPSVSFRSSMQTSMRASQGAAGPMASKMSQSGHFAPAPSIYFGDVTSSAKVNAFALEIERLNEKRLERAKYPIFTNLERIASGLKNTHMQQVFKIVQFVASEGVLGGEPAERAYESGYLKSPHDSRAAIELRQKFVAGARAYLEESYLSFMEDEIQKFPEAARLGGVPSLFAKIRAYMNVKYMKRGTWEGPKLEYVGGQPVYAIAYYFMRTGHERKALEHLSALESKMCEEDRIIVAAFHQYLSKEERRVSSEMRNVLLSEYNARFRNAKNVDPYQMALYKIIGHCDLAKKAVPGVTPTVDDWMWMQLVLIHETHDAEQPAHERYSLRDLQDELLRYGPQYFDPKGHNPLQYVRLLLQSAQFEQAVGFMHAQSQFQVEAVQLAVGLAYYGLLRVPESPDSSNPDIVVTTGDQRGEQATHLVDFALLCQQYSWNLQASAPRFALQYLVEICLFAGGGGPVADAYRKACYMAIVTMAVSSGDMDEILGSHQFDVRSPGMVERYLPLIHIQDMNEYRRLIVEPAADQCGKAGRWRDAVKLYHVAEDYDTVVALFNRELGAAFQRIAHSPSSTSTSVESSAMIPELDLRHMAYRVVNEYYGSRPEILEKISPRSLRTFHLLMESMEFVKEYQSGNLQAALQRIDALSLIPFEGAGALTPGVDYRELGEDFVPHLSEILVTTMTVITKLYERDKSAAYNEEARRRNLESLRRKAIAVTSFAGSLKFKLPRDTYASLSRMEAFIR